MLNLPIPRIYLSLHLSTSRITEITIKYFDVSTHAKLKFMGPVPQNLNKNFNEDHFYFMFTQYHLISYNLIYIYVTHFKMNSK